MATRAMGFSPAPSFFPLPSKRRSFFFSSIKPPSSLAITASSAPCSLPPMKLSRCPAIERRTANHGRYRFVRKLKDLLVSKRGCSIPLSVLHRNRANLDIPSGCSLLSMIQMYPDLFALSPLNVSLTPAAAVQAADESRLHDQVADALAAKLHRLLMLTPYRRLLLSKLAYFAADLCMSPNFCSHLCTAYPNRFRSVHTSYGRAVELASSDPSLSEPLDPIHIPSKDDPLSRPIISRPLKFPKLRFRRGFHPPRRHHEYMIRFHALPEVNPYENTKGETAELEEKRACAVVREMLAMTREKKTLVDHLMLFRKDFGLPNRLRAMLLRHPDLFYVCISRPRNTVSLMEAYDNKGKLLVEDELTSAEEKLRELVRKGKKMMKSEAWSGEEEEDEASLEDYLFGARIGDDWEEMEEEDKTQMNQLFTVMRAIGLAEEVAIV